MESVYSPHAPRPAGPYAHAARGGPLLALSGQIGTDPATGKRPVGFTAQAEQVFANLDNVLAAAGAAWTDVIKVQVFLANWDDFAELNRIYTETVCQRILGATNDPDLLPARTTVGAVLLGDVLIEADVLAWMGGTGA